ncbi:GGDEF domain-containing protein [Novosphingobium sp. 1949]|uniref:diguanylate cyclase n=1 Tax=Novosphingobium organovorum TaxID=2930092 RepID=A0ABT0BE57_9SPHN|nr:GGDEF domain-containing protein [Novosphingobium organovorum]MCJ2183195.1 GGDEF domain-containing protein [Novosphingobium organovorum]
MIGNSRFDRLTVWFRYADGAIRREEVRAGHYGQHWRAGGQIAFEPPQRDVPLRAMVVRFDRPASASLLRLRLIDRAELSRESTLLAGLIGAAMTLLAVGALFNFTLALSSRFSFSIWQAGWAVCMVAWGALWSQLALFVWPGLAGAPSAQICTGLSCLAVALASLSVLTAIEASCLSWRLRVPTLALALLIAALGLPLSLLRSGPFGALGDALGALMLLDLLAVSACLVAGWRAGSREARFYVGAWAVPMATLAVIELVDIDTWFYGAGSQIVILCAAAWQTLFLSVASSRASGQLRAERDLALRAEAQARELARIDPLTGLRNRRGFQDVVEPMLAHAGARGGHFALLLLDVDRFKAVNDTFGHDAGDAVLVAIARCLDTRRSETCRVARLGGEEFALAVGGLEGFALLRFADDLRRAIAACEHGEATGGQAVTVSIGLASARPGMTFRDLYRDADAALYAAKNSGRNRVVAHRDLDLRAGAGG